MIVISIIIIIIGSSILSLIVLIMTMNIIIIRPRAALPRRDHGSGGRGRQHRITLIIQRIMNTYIYIYIYITHSKCISHI